MNFSVTHPSLLTVALGYVPTYVDYVHGLGITTRSQPLASFLPPSLHFSVALLVLLWKWRRRIRRQRRRHYDLASYYYHSTSSVLGCQLLGMNCATPTEFALSWPSFCERGGGTDIHADGWGLVRTTNNQSGPTERSAD